MAITSSTMNSLDATLNQYGADLDALHRFDESDPDLLPYATLLNARTAGDDDLEALFGVYEWQDSPLMFLVNRDHLRDDEHLRKIRRLLAMRGDAPYLGVARPGQLQVYQISLDARSPSQSRIPLEGP
ncbi:MAG TPA: hypothetical protein VHG28_22235, partial [Longimicrobiaceae bacterium]|nr:hypothetical protein [Longimicrobiaceae bacterium]